jgi:hypothetical protein
MSFPSAPYPVTFDVERPPTFQRAHVFLRLAVLVVIGWIGHPLGLLWVGLPVVAAILVSQKGGRRYVDENGTTVIRVLNWILYLVASALLRILYAIPSLIVLAILGFFGAIVWAIALVLVLANETYPESLWQLLYGIVRWEACLLAYLASLVDRYPPFTLETGSVSSAAPSS